MVPHLPSRMDTTGGRISPGGAHATTHPTNDQVPVSRRLSHDVIPPGLTTDPKLGALGGSREYRPFTPWPMSVPGTFGVGASPRRDTSLFSIAPLLRRRAVVAPFVASQGSPADFAPRQVTDGASSQSRQARGPPRFTTTGVEERAAWTGTGFIDWVARARKSQGPPTPSPSHLSARRRGRDGAQIPTPPPPPPRLVQCRPIQAPSATAPAPPQRIARRDIASLAGILPWAGRGRDAALVSRQVRGK
jgi:hypothetical protein